MKINDVLDELDKKISSLDGILVSDNDAWLNEEGTDHARMDGKSVQLDVDDEDIRKKVFTRSILRAINKANWHTDIIKTVEDVDSDSEKSKIGVFCEGSYMFPNYRIYLKEDGLKRDEWVKEAQETLKTLWKTDREFFLDAVKEIVSGVVLRDFCGYFLRYFNDNEYGISIEDVKKDEEAVKIIKDIVFNNLTDVSEQCDEDD